MTGKKLLIFGPPGAGKGTQAVRLAKVIGVPHVSTGDMFRHHIKNGTELGKKVASFSNEGKLVPDEVTIEMVRDRLNQDDVKAGFLLDGFPRSVPQARALDRILTELGAELDAVINIVVSDEEIRTRLSKRAAVEGRADDADPLVIQNRIDTYKRQSEPCLAYYAPRGIVKDVDGIGAIDDVFVRVREAVGAGA